MTKRRVLPVTANFWIGEQTVRFVCLIERFSQLAMDAQSMSSIALFRNVASQNRLLFCLQGKITDDFGKSFGYTSRLESMGGTLKQCSKWVKKYAPLRIDYNDTIILQSLRACTYYGELLGGFLFSRNVCITVRVRLQHKMHEELEKKKREVEFRGDIQMSRGICFSDLQG